MAVPGLRQPHPVRRRADDEGAGVRPLSGEQEIEEREVLSDVVEKVTCRWCNGVDTVELVERPSA